MTDQALARYNQLFDNQQYQSIAHSLADDLNLDRESLQVSDAMNEVTNVALALCGHTHYADAWLKLAAFCGYHPVSDDTLRKLHTYLLMFQQSGDTHADDFELTAKALQRVHVGQQQIGEAVAHANGIHGWRGRMAYHLLTASDFLTQAATQLLIAGDASYIREKLQRGIQHIVWAFVDSNVTAK